MKLYKFAIPSDTVKIFDGVPYTGVCVIVLATSVHEARALAFQRAEDQAADTLLEIAWLDHVEPEEISLSDPRVVTWIQL